jgi:CMP-N-acetylneuraminic acid synthetase
MKKIKLFVIIKESSERVPSKNFKVLGDKPLWKHLLYELFPYDVFVDTDSMEVLEQCSTDTNLSHVTAYLSQSILIIHGLKISKNINL